MTTTAVSVPVAASTSASPFFGLSFWSSESNRIEAKRIETLEIGFSDLKEDNEEIESSAISTTTQGAFKFNCKKSLRERDKKREK